MATSQKTSTNKQHAAFPALFKRSGEARRIKGYRANRESFNRAMRLAKALDGAHRLTIYTQIGVIHLSISATELIKEDGAVAALILNGFTIMPCHEDDTDLNHFLSERGIASSDIKQGDMFTEEDN